METINYMLKSKYLKIKIAVLSCWLICISGFWWWGGDVLWFPIRSLMTWFQSKAEMGNSSRCCWTTAFIPTMLVEDDGSNCIRRTMSCHHWSKGIIKILDLSSDNSSKTSNHVSVNLISSLLTLQVTSQNNIIFKWPHSSSGLSKST